MLTLILQDEQGGLQALGYRGDMGRYGEIWGDMGRYGLQVLGRGGGWLDVPAIQGELTILLGDYLSWLSGGETVIALYLPTSPYISLHLPTSPYISLHLPISPYICLDLASST